MAVPCIRPVTYLLAALIIVFISYRANSWISTFVMTSNYKLFYFNIRGRAEPARYLFALADVPYVDERVCEFGAKEWPPMKPSFLCGTLPELEVDGIRISQSGAIARFLARQFGYMGKDKFEEARIEMLMGYTDDMFELICNFMYTEDPAIQAEMKKACEADKLPPFIKNMNKFLCDNNGGDGWFVGQSVTLADIWFHNALVDLIIAEFPNALESYPKLSAFKKRFEEHPKIAAWIAARPVTDG